MLPRRSALKIGVLLDSMVQARWVQQILIEIERSDMLQLSLIVLNLGRPPSRTKCIPSDTLYKLYEALDQWTFRIENDPLELVDLSRSLSHVELLRVLPISEGGVQRFPDDDLNAIRSHNLDVTLRFGFGNHQGDILGTARHGVWSCHHGARFDPEDGPPLFHKILDANPISETTLRILTKENGTNVYRSAGATDMTSLHRVRMDSARRSRELILRRLRDLYAHGWEYITALDTCDEKVVPVPHCMRKPTNLVVLRFLAKLAYRILLNRISTRLFVNEWSVGVRQRRTSDLEAPSPQAFVPIRPLRGRFFADPMPIEVEGNGYVFFEDWDHAAGKAVISYVSIGSDGKPSAPRLALERDYHLSYPFVFRWEGQVYMIPETERNRSIELYRALEFPERWELEKTLFTGVQAFDATVLWRGGKLWLFASMCLPGGSPNDDLFLFYADSPFGDWTPHPMNPVVSDVTRARPAGTLFMRGEELLRPGQDCSVRYGYAVTLNRIDVLTVTEYREVPIARIEPGWYPGAIGTHTLSRSENLEVIDWKVRVRR